MEKRYLPFDPFILAHNVRQVYYVPYPSSRKDKKGWCVAIKTKPRGHIESLDMEDDVPYQIDEMTHVNEVIEVEGILGFQHSQVDVEQVEEDNEEEFEEDNEEGNEEEFEDSENEDSEDVYIEEDSEDGQLERNDSEEDNEDDKFDDD